MRPPQKEDEQQMVIKEVFHMVSKRDENSCNFLEGSRLADSGVRLPQHLSIPLPANLGEVTGG